MTGFEWAVVVVCLVIVLLLMARQIDILRDRLEALEHTEQGRARFFDFWLLDMERRLRRFECSQSPEAREAGSEQSSVGSLMGKTE